LGQAGDGEEERERRRAFGDDDVALSEEFPVIGRIVGSEEKGLGVEGAAKATASVAAAKRGRRREQGCDGVGEGSRTVAEHAPQNAGNGSFVALPCHFGGKVMEK